MELIVRIEGKPWQHIGLSVHIIKGLDVIMILYITNGPSTKALINLNALLLVSITAKV